MEINKEIIFKDYPPLKIDEETRKRVLSTPERHLNCPVKIRMGKFYTDEEWEKRSKRVLSMKLPGHKKRMNKN